MKTNGRSLAIALVFAVVLVAGLVFLKDARSGPGERPQAGSPPNPSSCLTLRVLSSSEKAALLSGIAGDFNRSGATLGGECVQVKVLTMSSGAAEQALALGWDEKVDGPAPEVWSPASTAWVVLLRQRLKGDTAPMLPDAIPHLAFSPLVIAMPKPMAVALGWPSTPIGWSDILALAKDPVGWGRLGHPEWGAFRLGKTNPNLSTSGLNALIGAYFAATGVTGDLSLDRLSDPKVVEFVRGVESSVVHYGDISLTFLQNLQAADDRGAALSYVSAIAIEEKSIWDYNHGNPSGNPADLGKHAAPRVPLVAIYPREGTLASDHPYVALNAPWVDQSHRQAAAQFLSFVQTPAEQQHFLNAGFRDYQGKPGPQLTVKDGFTPTQPQRLLAPPSPEVLDRIQRSWTDVRKRTRLTLLVDVSGSMGDSVAGTGKTKLELVQEAAVKALGQLAPDDEVSLTIFSTNLGPRGDQNMLELVPMGPLGNQAPRLRNVIQGLTPQNGTPLYLAIREAHKAMRAQFDPGRINALLVLTDGRNEYSQDDDLGSLVRQLQAAGEDRAVHIFTIGYGTDADLPTLRQIAAAAGGVAYNASDPRTIDAIFQSVFSNF
jgi:Ca-activated chloride channel family protein